jgi:predicted nucleic acid binding AN1-type Zn finger protein
MDQDIPFTYIANVKDLTIECLLRIGYNLMNIHCSINKENNDTILKYIKEICLELINRKNKENYKEDIDAFLYYTISPNN